MPLTRRRLPLLAALLCAALAIPATADVQPGPLDAPGQPLFPGLQRHELRVALAGETSTVTNVVSFDPADELLAVEPVLARGVVPGLETVPAIGGRLLGEGVVAAVNGGFWLSAPVGDPNGYLAVDGTLVSEAQTQGGGPRGTVALRRDGRLLVDRVETALTLATSGSGGVAERRVAGFNRSVSTAPPYPDPDDAILIYSRALGGEVEVEPLVRAETITPVRALVVDGLVPAASGSSRGTVAAVEGAGRVAIPSGGAVVVAHGGSADALAGVAPGDEVGLEVEVRPLTDDPEAWTDLEWGLAAGPLIARGGALTDPGDWENEGFSPEGHSNPRAPRSAIGVTSEGRVLLVTVDGRQPGYAAGMTIRELGEHLLALGASDVLSLDGGASSQLATDGFLRNRPCCDPQLRPVATALVVRHSYSFDVTQRLFGAGRDETAVEVARAGWPGGADEVLLAAGGSFPDALAGGPLSAAVEGPLLLTGPDMLSPTTAAELTRLQPETVTVLGGEQVVGPAVEAELRDAGYGVRRLAGGDRVSTAVEVAKARGPAGPRAFLASGFAFPDALTAAPVAGIDEAPILLTGRDALPEPVAALIDEADIDEVVVVGGPAAVGPGVVQDLQEHGVAVTRLAGGTRFATARAVGDWASAELACQPVEAQDPPCLDPSGLLVARGDDFPDALAGGALAAARRQLLMILPAVDVNSDPDAAGFLADRQDAVGGVALLGGHAGLSSFEHWQLDQLAR